MASARQQELSFSSSRGENIYLSEDLKEVSWFPRQSGNYIYASQCLKSSAPYIIEVNGSGHVDIGIVTVNPEEISCERRHPSFKRMNEVKVHKRTFNISVRLQNNEVMSRYNEEEYKIRLDPEKSAWIAIYPKFGEISASIKIATQMALSRRCGNNIRLAENDTKAFTINKCPAAICFPTCILRPKNRASFQCTPASESDKKPSRFHLKIMAHRNDPRNLLEDFKGTFDTSVKSTSDPPWTYIDLLDRDVCEGKIILTLTDTNSVTCVTDKDYKKEMSLPFDASAGVWLIFELYRVTLRLLDFSAVQEKEQGNVEAGASGSGLDELDSISPEHRGKENLYVDEPNNKNMNVTEPRNPRCRPEFCLDLSEHGYGASGVTGELSLIQEGVHRIENKVEKLHEKLDKHTSDPRKVISPDALSPPASPATLSFRGNLVALINDLNADDIIDHLFQENMINKNLFDKVNVEKVPRKASRILLHELLGKTVDRTIFERILKDTEQQHLIKFFFPDDTEAKKSL